LILHLSGGGNLNREVSRQLAEASLRAEEFTDAYLAMGRLAGCAPARVLGVVIDYNALTDDVREFPRLARSLVAGGIVYVYGEGGAMHSDPGMIRSGARLAAAGEQVNGMVAELQRLMWRRHAREASAAAKDLGPGKPAPPEPAGQVEEQADSSRSDTARLGDGDRGESSGPDLRVVKAAPLGINPAADALAADALANAAARHLADPVLEVVEPEDDPIARILPEPDQDGPPTETPTPWSPSSRRPTRTPPKVEQAPPDDGPREPGPIVERSDEPLLTPDELDALLGRQEQA
jgi:hypothetical protein